MNAPSRSSNASGRPKRPQRPLPVLPPVHETKNKVPQLSHLVKEDVHKPFKLLENHPLNLICQFHNVKRVSLEDGVPPPPKFDVPVLRGAVENSDALLPTYVLAVYDQNYGPEQTDSSSTLSPHTAESSSGQSSLPATPLLIPINADLWQNYFTASLPAHSQPEPSSSPVPAVDNARRHSRTDSMVSRSSQSSSRNSPARSRPRSVLSLPVHIVRVPSARALPLLLLFSLRILPHDAVFPALLPRKVLAELPAPPAILAQHLLHWLYPTPEDRERRSLGGAIPYSPFFKATLVTENMPMSIPRSPRPPPSPLLSPSFTPDSAAMKRLSSASTSSFFSATSSISSLPSPASPRSDQNALQSEPICALADASIRDDPDLRLLALAQQNFGLWADALSLGVRDPAVVRLVELAWSVASEARRIRFATGSDDHPESEGRQTRAGMSRSRSRTPIPSPGPVPFARALRQ